MRFAAERATTWLAVLLCLLLTISGAALDEQRIEATPQCFFPGGAISTGQACSAGQPHSLCCPPGYSCLSNGVCHASSALPSARPSAAEYYRPSCTDPNWKSPSCPQFCIGDEDGHTAGQALQLCDEAKGTFCCKHSIDCCSNSTLVFALGRGDVVQKIPAINDPASSTNARAANATVSPAGSSDEGLNTASKVGLGLGLGLTGLICFALAMFLYVRRRRRQVVNMPEGSHMKGLDSSDSSTSTLGKTTEGSPLEALELGDLARSPSAAQDMLPQGDAGQATGPSMYNEQPTSSQSSRSPVSPLGPSRSSSPRRPGLPRSRSASLVVENPYSLAQASRTSSRPPQSDQSLDFDPEYSSFDERPTFPSRMETARELKSPPISPLTPSHGAANVLPSASFPTISLHNSMEIEELPRFNTHNTRLSWPPKNGPWSAAAD